MLLSGWKAKNEGDATMPKTTFFVDCPHCGARFDETLKKCPTCYAKNLKSVCRTCGAQINAYAKRCPSCGAWHRQRVSPAVQALAVFLCFFGIVLGVLFVTSMNESTASNSENVEPQLSREEYIAQCENPPYSDVERSPDKYEGEKVAISGTVIQVLEEIFDTVTLRVETPDGVWHVTYARSDGESRILYGDQITCYGECKGVETYIAPLGNQITIPSLSMKYYDLK